jgi:hypothetical protein
MAYYAHRFLGADSADACDHAIRALVARSETRWRHRRDLVARRPAAGHLLGWWPPPALAGLDSAVRLSRLSVLAFNSELGFRLTLKRRWFTRTVRVVGVELIKRGMDGVDPIACAYQRRSRRWLRPGFERLTCEFVRGRRYLLGARRPLRKAGPWLANISRVHNAGEWLDVSQFTAVMAMAVGDLCRRPLRWKRGLVILDRAVAVPMCGFDRPYWRPEDAFAELIGLLGRPDGDLAPTCPF